MTAKRPEPGSPWERHCPDAWPREWLDRSGELPPGFARAADPHEADLIAGRITEPAFLAALGRLPGRSGSSAAPPSKRKPSAVVRKLLGYRRFFDDLSACEDRMSAGAVALWCWLWTCERKGLSLCSARRLGRRFGVHPSTAMRWLAELREAGLVRLVRRGRTGLSASVVRVATRGVLRPCDAGVAPVQQEHSSTK